MSYYDLVDSLKEMEVERKKRLLVEATTIDAITFIPAQLGVVKAKIQSLAKEKPEWGLKVLEAGTNKIFQIEDRLQITVPIKYWGSFLTIFDKKNVDGDTLNLRTALNEAMEDDMKKLRKELKPTLTEMFNEQQFTSLDKAVNIWKSWFGVFAYKTGEGKGPVVSQERKQKNIQSLYGKLLKAYGEDRGNLEMLTSDINGNKPLNSYDVFKNYDFLYGTRILSYQDKVPMIFEAQIDMIFTPSQSIYVGNDKVLDKIESEIKTVKRVKKVLYPVGGSFSPKFFRILKDTVEDAVTDEISEPQEDRK